MRAAAASRLGLNAGQSVRISPADIAWGLRDQVARVAWSTRQVTRHQLARTTATAPVGELTFSSVLPPDTAEHIPHEARKPVLAAADRLMGGEWDVHGVLRTDLERPDWFRDPVSGRRSAQDQYAFRIDHRCEDQVGNITQVWELSRLQHLTLLATAWFLTHDERYAQRVADHLRSWWRANPFLSGVNWTSGVELGIRLISLAWIRRLLNDWAGVADLFERDALALRQIRWHQQYLAAFASRGSSAGRRLIAEAAGQLVVSCAFPWFRESDRWRRKSALLLERELDQLAVSSGPGRELASDYHCFAVELGLVAAVEADASGHPLRPAVWARLCALTDSAAALVDERLRPPRRSDSDDGRGLLLDAPTSNRRMSMLALAEAMLGPQEWWPRTPASAASSIVGALAGPRRQIEGRPSQRPSRFADAGITLLRTRGEQEIWCRCDGAPNMHGSVGAHVRADALSFEVRFAGVDILTDPDTWCYAAGPGGRRRLRHGGILLRGHHAHFREIEVLDDGDIARWTAEHDVYASRDPSALHRRSVLLDRASRIIDIIDQLDGGSRDIRLAFHLGPDVHAKLKESCAVLEWPTASAPGAARLELPPGLLWSLHRGGTGPTPGWCSQDGGRFDPAFTLLGCGPCVPGIPLITRLEFLGVGEHAKSAVSRQAISWTTSAAPSDSVPEIQAEAR